MTRLFEEQNYHPSNHNWGGGTNSEFKSCVYEVTSLKQDGGVPSLNQLHKNTATLLLKKCITVNVQQVCFALLLSLISS